MSQSLSNKIHIYSFILTILVIYVHAANLASNNVELEAMAATVSIFSPLGIENFLSNTLGQVAVPGFFILSAFLFYRNLDALQKIPDKWRSRISTIFLPYVFWNALMYFLNVFMGRAYLSRANLSDAMANYSYNPVFWYLYQLILLIILAPIFYLFLKHFILSILGVFIVLTLIYLRFDIAYLNEDAMLYYFVGAFLARHRRKEMETEGYSISHFLIFTGTFLVSFICRYIGGDNIGLLLLSTVLYRLSFPLMLWSMLPAKKLFVAKPYMKINFFIYAMHYLLIRASSFLLKKALIYIASPLQESILLLWYLLLPIVLICVLYQVSKILKKMPKRVWILAAGGRG